MPPVSRASPPQPPCSAELDLYLVDNPQFDRYDTTMSFVDDYRMTPNSARAAWSALLLDLRLLSLRVGPPVG